MFPAANGTKSLKLTSFTRDNLMLAFKRVLFSLLFAGITGACAKLRLYLPFTPVPVTGQVFAVLICGAVLGKEYGALSQIFYISFGMMGIPWFVIGPVGPTGGYLVGFILAPYLIGFIVEKLKRPGFLSVTLAMLAAVFVIYLFGLIQFSLFTQKGIVESFPLSVVPFIPFDIAKAVAAAAGAMVFLRKTGHRK
jgi:biotin transport system substrate-specific component